jgi:hypothetical protein
MDERVNIDHTDPEAVISALLKVDPDGPPEIEDAARDEMAIPADETDEG